LKTVFYFWKLHFVFESYTCFCQLNFIFQNLHFVKIHLLASGSSGNCTLITAGEGIHATRICLDCGIPQRTARLLAERCGETLANLDGVFRHRSNNY
jgi:hypothetical protein